MDEILIGEKKYVSSKQAAKMTGYAKDYIGQLCREGRVPARLVGRSWYVLESAIQDHRFGDSKNEPVEGAKPATSPLYSTWEAPRYEASETEALPSVNRLHGGESSEPADEENKGMEVAQRLQDTWQAWFDRFDHVADAASGHSVAAEEPEKEQEEAKTEQSHEVKIPIHAIHHPRYQPPPEELLPRHLAAKPPSEEEVMWEERREERGARGVGRAVQVAGALLAVLMAVLAVAGSGYLDKYIVSNKQVGIIAGVAVYNK